MTMTVDYFQPSNAPAAMDEAHTSTPTPGRKRKEMEEDMDEESNVPSEGRRIALKSLRHFTSASRNGEEQAHFHPLPHDLNMQLLANLGYMQPAQPTSLPRDLSAHSVVSHSPSSSFSDFGGPSTPSDMASSAESYFSKGMRDSNARYPTFEIYPNNDNRSRSPGLLGMHMPPPSVGSADANGMQMDGMEEVAPSLPAPVHGSHCKSIPQLHVRSEPGVSSELWAFCPDCGTRSKVDSPPVSDALSYSP